MIISPLKGKYYAKDCDGMNPFWGPMEPERLITLSLESRLEMLATTELYNGLPEEVIEEISVDISNSFLYYLGSDYDGIVPLTTAQLSDQTLVLTFSWADSDIWIDNIVGLADDAEIWLFLNPTATWPTFWDGNLRPRGAAIYVPGPYV